MATMHGKEAIVGPLFQQAFQWLPSCCEHIDTDVFGTFTGEKERTGHPVDALRNKIHAAASLKKADFYLATEGSFGPHPQCAWLPFHEEWMMLSFPESSLEWVEVIRSNDTNFCTSIAEKWIEVVRFAWKIGFPEHRIIIRCGSFLRKGVGDWDTLNHLFLRLKTKGPIHLETDMRAMYNPTRQKAISRLAKQLIQRLHYNCPSCHSPGFGLVRYSLGLPCRDCAMPTTLVKSEWIYCEFCSFEHCTDESERPFADPGNCSFCNP